METLGKIYHSKPSNNKIIGISLSVVILITLLIFASICFAKKRQNSNANIFRQIEDGEAIEPVKIVSNHGRFMASWNTRKVFPKLKKKYSFMIQ